MGGTWKAIQAQQAPPQTSRAGAEIQWRCFMKSVSGKQTAAERTSGRGGCHSDRQHPNEQQWLCRDQEAPAASSRAFQPSGNAAIKKTKKHFAMRWTSQPDNGMRCFSNSICAETVIKLCITFLRPNSTGLFYPHSGTQRHVGLNLEKPILFCLFASQLRHTRKRYIFMYSAVLVLQMAGGTETHLHPMHMN